MIIGPLRRHLSVATLLFGIYFISDHKKHGKSSLEPEKHENQLFMSVRNRETGKWRGFGSTSAPKTAHHRTFTEEN